MCGSFRGYRAIVAAWAVLVTIMAGCATTAHVDSRWHDSSTVVDGRDGEWTGRPQYYDGDRQLVVRVTNDASAMTVCIATGDVDLKRRLARSGLTVWLDPAAGTDQVFGIHLLGDARGGRDRRPPRGAGGASPPDAEHSPPTRVAITYPHTTGPLDMRLAEVRRAGIDIAVAGAPDGRQVYELRIAFSAAPELVGHGPGKSVGLGIFSSGDASRGHSDGSPSGRPPEFGRGGGMGPPPGGGRGPGGRPGNDGPELEIWLNVKLAVPAAGRAAMVAPETVTASG